MRLPLPAPYAPKFVVIFSYMGARYTGVQRQTRRGSPNEYRDRSVQAALELALNNVNPTPDDKWGDVLLNMSSRTDSGVHAFGSSAHFHMLHPVDNQVHDCKSLVSSILLF